MYYAVVVEGWEPFSSLLEHECRAFIARYDLRGQATIVVRPVVHSRPEALRRAA